MQPNSPASTSPHAGTALRMANRGNAEFGKFGNNSYFQTSPLISNNTAFPRPSPPSFHYIIPELPSPTDYRQPIAWHWQDHKANKANCGVHKYFSLQHVRVRTVSQLKEYGHMSGNVLLVVLTYVGTDISEASKPSVACAPKAKSVK